jgi:glycosyltransferase involved in cell wall biosynthesis
VRFVPRFVDDLELPAYFRRADLVVLPYRAADQSGVLATALAFGKPMVVSDVGGFGELGAARLVPPGDEEALAAALNELLADPAAREELAAAAARAAAGPYSWAAAAEQTVALYRQLLAR